MTSIYEERQTEPVSVKGRSRGRRGHESQSGTMGKVRAMDSPEVTWKSLNYVLRGLWRLMLMKM